MAKPISPETRILLVIAVFERGFSRRAVAELSHVTVASAVRWCQLWLEFVTVGPLPVGGDRRCSFKRRNNRKIHRWLRKKTDVTVDKIRVRLAAQGLEVSNS